MSEPSAPDPRTRWPRASELDVWLAMAILLGFLVLCSLQVVSRFVLTLPFTWTEELSAALIIWMTFLGAIAVERRDSQIRVDMMQALLAPKALALLYLVFDIVILITLGALVIGGWHTLSETAYQRTPALGIPYNLITAAVPLAAVPLGVFVIRNTRRRIKQAWQIDAKSETHDG